MERGDNAAFLQQFFQRVEMLGTGFLGQHISGGDGWVLVILDQRLVQHDDIADMMELVEGHSNCEIADWLSSLNRDREVADMEKDTMIQDMMDEFYVKYEMLTFLSDWEMTSEDEDKQKKIANYIGGTIRENAKTTED